jgi:Uma2 family endonuclease
MSVQPETRYTVEEYLAMELASREKHEYFEGEVFATTGASFSHTVVAGNVSGELRLQLKGKPCRVAFSDLRVRTGTSGLFTYPDVVVVCGQPKLDQPGDTLTNPAVIIEVLSESTEAYDRGRKFELYQAIESLTDYLLVAQDTPRIEHYRRQAGRQWLYTLASGIDASVAIASIGCELKLAEVYEKVDGLREPGTYYR